jgi:hypothetical protein
MVSETSGIPRTELTSGAPYIIAEEKLSSRELRLEERGIDLLLDSLSFPYVLMLLAGLMLADGLITEYLVNSGVASEGNPFMQGPLSGGYFMPVKIIGAWLSALILASIHRHNPKLAAAVAWAFIVVYCVTVYWNIGGFIAHLGY